MVFGGVAVRPDAFGLRCMQNSPYTVVEASRKGIPFLAFSVGGLTEMLAPSTSGAGGNPGAGECA